MSPAVGLTLRTGSRGAPHTTRLAAVLLAAAGLALLAAGPATAHAVLVEADPADGTTLEAPPEHVSLVFNEGVEVPQGGLRVYDADGQRVDDGPLDTAAAETVAVALPDDLAEGGYLATYRVVSADSHPVAGAVSFRVGDAEDVDDAVVERLLGGGDGLVGAVGSALRGLGYLTTLLAAGAALFAVAVARAEPDRARARRVGLRAVAAALAVTLVSLPVQTMAVTGFGPLAALGPTAVGETLQSTFGQGWLVRVAALGLLAAAWARTGHRWPALAAGVVAACSFALDGHQRSAEPTWLLVPGDLVHLLAGALWVGGLVLLVACVRARSLSEDPVGAARLVSRFSTLALASVVALAATGTAMAWALVRVPGALVDTGYGRLLLAKLVLVAVAVAVAAYNRWRLVPAVTARVPAGGAADAPATAPATSPRSRAAWARLRSTLAVEAALLVAVLAVTGFLVVQRPAAEAAGITGLYETTVAITDELDLDVVVDPNEAGRTNAIHLYVLDATGRPAGDVDDLHLELAFAEEDIGPLPVEPFPAGPGHWVANVDELAFAGEWTVRVTLGVDRFDEERVEVTVPVS